MCHEILVPSTSSENVCNLLIVGTLADIVEDQMARIFEKLGIQNVEFFPPKSSEKKLGFRKNKVCACSTLFD